MPPNREFEKKFDESTDGIVTLVISALFLLAALIGTIFLCVCGKRKKEKKTGSRVEKITGEGENASGTTESMKTDADVTDVIEKNSEKSKSGKSISSASKKTDVPEMASKTQSAKPSPRKPLDPAAQDEARKSSKAIANLAIQLYRIIATPKANVVFSPASIAMALALMEPEVNAESQKRIRQLLTSPGSELYRSTDTEQLHRSYRSLLRCFESIDDAKGKVSIANAFYHDDPNVSDDRAKKMKERIDAEIAAVAFKTDPERARRQINSWVSEKTESRVPELFKSGTIQQSSRAVLANAVLLKATWSEMMERGVGWQKWTHPSSHERTQKCTYPFYEFGKRDQAKTVPFLENLMWMRYVSTTKLKAVELPCYKHVDLSMFIILPHDGVSTIESIEQSLESDDLLWCYREAGYTNVDFAMPKFAFRQSIDLKVIFGQLGLQAIFPDGVTAYDRGEIKITDAAHEMFIKVDENGIEGAEAPNISSVKFSPDGPGPVIQIMPSPTGRCQFKADHPFLFAIFYKPTKAIVSMGKVMKVTDD